MNEICLVHKVGKFRNDNAFTVIPGVSFDHGPGSHSNDSPPRFVCRNDTLPSIDKARCGEIRPMDILHESFHINIRITNQCGNAVNKLAKIVRWYIGGHTNGDAGRSIEEQSRYL